MFRFSKGAGRSCDTSLCRCDQHHHRVSDKNTGDQTTTGISCVEGGFGLNLL